MATASVNILFGASTAYPLLLAFWGLNGLLQARCCWAACRCRVLYSFHLLKMLYGRVLLLQVIIRAGATCHCLLRMFAHVKWHFAYVQCTWALRAFMLALAGPGVARVRAHPDVLVPRPRARHLLGLLDRQQQHRRLPGAHHRRQRRRALRLAVRPPGLTVPLSILVSWQP